MATNSKFAVARSRYLRVSLWRLRPSRFCVATRLPLHLGSGRFKNEEAGASRTCHFAGRASCALPQVDRAFQNRQGHAATGGRCFTAFSEHADSLDGGLSNWTADEILLEHSRGVAWLLHKLQSVLADGAVRATGFLALFYAAVLFTEGIGVYMQQRWAELLMIFATASLIPIEIRHLWHRPGLVGVLILLVNCFIVWFLYRVLKPEKPDVQIAPERELVETV